MKKFESSCACGTVSTVFTLPVTAVVECHCQLCRRMQGASFMNWIAVPNGQITVTKGSDSIASYWINERSSKFFCKQCGSTVFGENGKHFPEHKAVPLGSVLNYSQELAPKHKVYTDSAAPWLE